MRYLKFSESVTLTAAHIHAGTDKMPDTALFTEESFKIEKIAEFAAAQTADDVFGRFAIGTVCGKNVLYREIKGNGNNIFYRDLIRCLKIKNVTAVVKAQPLKKTECGFADIADFIRFGGNVKTGKNRIAKKGGIYAVSDGEPTEAEKRALAVLGADGVGENTLPLLLMSENINLRAVMMFEGGNTDELEI